MNTREFNELLKGCRPHRDADGNILIQSIMNMELVTLTTDDEYSMDDRFENPLTALNASNASYGQITFKNKTNKEVITPAQIAVLTKQSAQNHGMVKGGYIGAGSDVTFNDAGCVQGSQTGYFSGTQEFRMIPASMREMLFEVVGNTGGHSNIYPAINKLGVDTKSDAGNYLNLYFDKYDKKLEQFIAHFERPEKLIGVVVLIDGEIAVIDKYPSFRYAEQIWDMLIRDCYGALAIMSELKNKTANKKFSEVYSSKRKKQGESVLDGIEKALAETKKEITKSVEERIQDLLDLTFEAQMDTTGNPDDRSNAPKSYILKNEGYVGQVFSEDEYHHMVSIVRKETFDPTALRRVSELKRKARGQERFSL